MMMNLIERFEGISSLLSLHHGWSTVINVVKNEIEDDILRLEDI